MIKFLISPLFTLFSKHTYQHALKSGIGYGLCYLLYLAVLMSAFSAVLIRLSFLPTVNRFTHWLIQETPEMTLTASGLKTDTAQPYTLDHPVMGHLYTIDTAKTIGEWSVETTDAPVLIGRDGMIVRGVEPAKTNVYEFSAAMQQIEKAGQPLRITKRFLEVLAARVMSFAIPLILAVAAPIFLIWKLFSVLLVSLVAFVINRFQKEKIKYRHLFVLSCYAITPATLLQGILVSVSRTQANVFLLLSLAFNVCYLIFGLLATQPSASKQTNVSK